ncbi:hypothetical protein [Ammoniphilus sp. YIM 78166]|uniref:hypothetical protein n=1 Tax=Ammoniphilus sp. YIM 78166 TaxID=1644106 RepID=UPI00107042A5|nr:hypothetical protein [Ammoniphilus sp. YIM 78166]
METLKLSEIVLSVRPELYRLLTEQELDLPIVLKHGLGSIQAEDILQIIEASILYGKENDVLH